MRFDCEPVVGTGCKLNLMLPYRKVQQINLKAIIFTDGNEKKEDISTGNRKRERHEETRVIEK